MSSEPDVVALTVRMLKPGAYDEWRRGWHDPDDPDALWVEEESKAYILRNLDDPDEIVAIGFLHGDLADLQRLRKDPEIERKQSIRADKMAPSVAETLVDGAYEVLEVATRDSRPAPRNEG